MFNSCSAELFVSILRHFGLEFLTQFPASNADNLSVSVSVYYVAVRTIVLSRHGGNLAYLLSFMISFMALYMCQVLHIVDFLGSRQMETAPTSIEVLLRPTQSQSDEPSELRGSLSPTIVYTAPGSPRRSPIQLSTGRDVA